MAKVSHWISRLTMIVGLIFSTQVISADKATFKSEDIFNLEWVSQVAIAPDGSKIAYIRRSNDIMKDTSRRSLWLYDVKKKRHQPLYADQFNYGQVTWSADSQTIAFSSNRDGSNQIYVHWLATDSLALVTQLQKSVSNISFSPDGKWLAFTMEVPDGATDYAKSVYVPKKPEGAKWAEKPQIIEKARYQADGRGMLKPAYRHVFVIPVMGGTARQITSGDYQHRGPLAWTADSRAVVFSANRNDDWEYQIGQSDLFQAKLDGTSIEALTSRSGAEFSPRYSRDGKQLAYLTRTDAKVPYQNSELVILDIKSGKTKTITDKFDRSIANFDWFSDGDLLVQYDDRGLRLLARLSQSGKVTGLTDNLSGTSLGRPYISGSFSLADNGAIAFTNANSQKPADLGYLINNTEQVLTDLNADVLGHISLGQVNMVEYPSSFDGEMIQGWYITPPGFDSNQQYPLLVEIHGGPHLAYGPHFSAELQRYAAEGYVVFYANHRGSSSYGERFAMLLKGKYSSKEDFADHNSGVDAMLAKGFIDENNLFIAGGSAGGIASAYAIGLTDRFNAAAITKPVINWISKVLTADSYLGQIRNQFPGLPWENLEHYWQRSPLSLVANVTTPSLIMTGEQDRRTPMSESEQFYQALKLKQVDAALVRVPGASHGIASTPSRMVTKIEHTLAWFKRYQKD